MRGWMKRHKILTGLLVLLLLLVMLGSLNYSGMCIPEGRWLSDKEKIRRVVNNLIINGRDVVPVETKDGAKYYKQIKYENEKDFFLANPDCCRSGLTLMGDYFPPQLIDRITGVYGDKVELNYNLIYIDDSGHERSQHQTSQIITSNCANLFNY